jgi:hypothetical protein
VTIAGSPQKIQIYSTNPANTGTYTITIVTTETISGNLTDTRSFTLQVNCVTAITPSPALGTVTYYITDTATTITPTYSLTPSGCPNLLTFTVTQADNSALPSSITYSSGTISIHSNTFSDTGSYSIKVVARDPGTGVTNQETFSVVIKCTKTVSVQTNTIPASTTYALDPNNLSTITLTSPTYAHNPSGCAYTPTLAIKNVNTGTCPTWISPCSPAMNSVITIGTTDHTLEGTYNFKIDFVDTVSTLADSTVTFTIVIRIMDATSITKVTSAGDQEYQVTASTLSVDLPTYSWFPTQSHTAFTYALTSAPSFVTIGGNLQKIRIQTNDGSKTGVYTITTRTTETNSGLTNDQSFSLLVKCVQTINPNNLNDVEYFITDNAITRTLGYAFTPSDCPNELVISVT